MPYKERRLVQKIPDFDVLSEDPKRAAIIVEERLLDAGIKKVVITKHDAVGEIIPEHYEIRVGKDILGHIYQPIACHSYNEIHIDGHIVRVGTIDTLLTFYLAFIYSGIEYHDKDRILCMVEYLYKVQEKNRLEQKGILKRYSLNCIGKQPTLDDLRAEKAEKYKELASKRGTTEYNMWFLKYSPAKQKGATPTETEPATESDTKKSKPKSKSKTARKKKLNLVQTRKKNGWLL